jgi:hypothetical protein
MKFVVSVLKFVLHHALIIASFHPFFLSESDVNMGTSARVPQRTSLAESWESTETFNFETINRNIHEWGRQNCS